MLSSCWTWSPCQCMFAGGHFSIFLMFNLKFSKITSALYLNAWTLRQYLQVLHFCLTLINSNILSKAEENQLIYTCHAAMIQVSVNKLQIDTWAAPNNEYYTWTILEKVQQNKSFYKRMSVPHRANKQYVHMLKQTACICFHWSRRDRQLADSWGNTAGRELTASCVHPAQLHIRTTRPPGAWGWQTDKALPTHCTFPTFSESHTQLNLLSVCMPGAVVW